jgi:hypothetical protein
MELRLLIEIGVMGNSVEHFSGEWSKKSHCDGMGISQRMMQGE